MRLPLKRYAKYLPPVLGIILLIGIVLGLHRALRPVSLHAVLAALQATPRAQLLHACLLLADCCIYMAFYDLPGILFARRSIAFPWIGFRHLWFASFCAYSLSHVLGAPTISGTAIRVRLYALCQVPAAGIARIVALVGTTFALGTAVLLGGILLFDPLAMPLFGHRLSVPLLRGLGALLWALIGAYVAAARGKTPLVLFRREIQRPGLAISIGQMLLSCADTCTACAILFVVLPLSPGLDFAHVLALYLAGFAGGMVSGLPGGVGVLDTVLLLGLSAYMPASAAIGAILLYRALYYLVPSAIGATLFGAHEIFVSMKGRG